MSRFHLAFALFVLASIAGCSSDAPRGVSEPNVIASKPPPIKFLVVEGKLHAIVPPEAKSSAVLYVRARRVGRARSAGGTTRTQAITSAVGSCEDVRAEGSAIALADALPIAGDDYLLAAGPAVDPSLLRTIYPPSSAGRDLAAVVGDTHTAIAEGCIFDGDELLASNAEELADAADDGTCGLPDTGGPRGNGSPSNPNLRDSCVGRADGIYCSQLDDTAAIVCKGEQIAAGQQCIDGARCTGPNGAGDQIVCSAPSPGAGFRSLRPRAIFADGRYQCDAAEMKGKKAYTNACEKALGEMPMFKKKGDGSHERFTCLDNPSMKIVPITLTEGGKTTTIEGATKTCDAPAWLGYSDGSQCAPFTRAGKFSTDKADFVVICRRYKVRGKDDAAFDDINIIGSAKDTGETCFWNTHLAGNLDTSKGLPHPAEDVATDAKWMTLGDVGSVNCVSCHDADPWMHSPWIDQVKLVPRGARAPYKIVEGASLDKEAGGGTQWTSLEVIDEPDAKPCTSCHRIGKYNGASVWTPRSTGQSIGGDAWWDFASDYAKTYAQNRWMPDGEAPEEKDWATSKWAKAVEKITACGSDPASCKWAKIP